MKITIAAIGKGSPSSLETGMYNNYTKRLPWKIELKEFAEKKSLPKDQMMAKEAEMLLSAIKPSAKVIVMDEHGKNISSTELAAQISNWQQQGASDFAFLIGGADGHGNAVKERADFTLSLGKMTWPHMLVRSMLAEQLYRVYTILSGHPYHRE